MGLGKTLVVIGLVLSRSCTAWPTKGGTLRTVDGDEADNRPSSTPTNNDVLCSCGGDATSLPQLELLSCCRCDGPRQHSACVQYDAAKIATKLPIKRGYICPQCWSGLRVRSKATLIVAPDHIWQQWKEELQKHVKSDSISALVYAGMEAPLTPIAFDSTGDKISSPPPSTATSKTNYKTADNPFAPRTPVDLSKWLTVCGQSTTMTPAESDPILPGFVQPDELACADIVLTAYSVVQRELDWAEVASERRAGLGDRPKLRQSQRYLCRPSPLTCVEWWRVCLDEAQMVERVTSKQARMLFQLDAVHRWCITGTPAEKSVDDLFGLFAYLRFLPFSIPHYWNCLLYQPFLAATTDSYPNTIDNPEEVNDYSSADVRLEDVDARYQRVASSHLVEMLSLILWRNTKTLVGDQLQLPDVSERIHWVNFTSVERYIHDRVLRQSAGALERLLLTENSSTTSIDRDQSIASLPGETHWRLVNLITRLRQTCTHPSLVVGSSLSQSRLSVHRGRLRGQSRQDQSSCSTDALPPQLKTVAALDRSLGVGCLTMTEVIRRVVEEIRRECESLLRSWVFNKNGAAGCFILKKEFICAADCYRDVLRTVGNIEQRYGVLVDWSQRLHAITNLYWLITTQQVPLLDLEEVTAVEDDGAVKLDPRVDRDLLAKAHQLRLYCIESNSHLLSRAHSQLEGVVSDLQTDLSQAPSFGQAGDYVSTWLEWLAEVFDCLLENGLGCTIIDILVSSFQGRPNFSRGRLKTNLLHASSPTTFRSLLLTEVADVFKTRAQMRRAISPLLTTWEAFKKGETASDEILRPFYNCCARSASTIEDNKKKANGDNKDAITSKEVARLKLPRKSNKIVTHCPICVSAKALNSYQASVNHERMQPQQTSKRLILDGDDDLEDDLDFYGTGLNQSNPLIVSIGIVCSQLRKLIAHTDLPEKRVDWLKSAKKFEQMFRSMGKEVLLTGRLHRLTQEWWNLHDEMEQFVVRLQTSEPTDMAFIDSDEIELQLQSSCAEALLVWPQLQSRLAHLRYVRSAYVDAVSSTSTSTSIDCPICLQPHSPSNPTFVLLPACWHALCLPCHENLVKSKRNVSGSSGRCPLCRIPLGGDGSSSSLLANSRRRRPLTLIHYGDKKSSQSDPLSSQQGDRINGRSEAVADTLPDILGDHSSKVQAVIRCLKQIKSEDEFAKAIVFSSWLSVLVTLAQAMQQNDIPFTTLFKARDACCPNRLTAFQCLESPTNWVLLIPIQLGSNGLNLTSANHVLLVDPVLSHGREAQAIARMHRIGQTRPGTVHRFLVRDSIEAALHHEHSRHQQQANCYSDQPMLGGRYRSCRRSTGGLVSSNDEDRAQLMQLTVGQLMDLLHIDELDGINDANDEDNLLAQVVSS